MGKTTGFAHLTCDVKACGKEAYLADSDPMAAQWKTARHVTADGVEQTFLLCPDHASAYAAIARAQDANTNAFIEKGI